MDYRLNILGSGSAKPIVGRFQTSQILEMRERQFMIDCGEGAQIRMSQNKVRVSRLSHIFISHLHGDHCLGLIGMLSTFGMLGRTNEMVIHSAPELEKLIGEQLRFFMQGSQYEVRFEPFSPYRSEVIYEDRTVTVRTLPLVHTVPTCGFLFEEKRLPRHLNKPMCDAWKVPIAFYQHLQAGDDFVTDEGEVVDNSQLTFEPTPSKRFAYMSDTAYTEKHLDAIEGVDLLYHETTYLSSVDPLKLKTRMHSSAAQAAILAKKAGVKKLVMGHYSSQHRDVTEFEREARAIFAESYAATDGSAFDF